MAGMLMMCLLSSCRIGVLTMNAVVHVVNAVSRYVPYNEKPRFRQKQGELMREGHKGNSLRNTFFTVRNIWHICVDFSTSYDAG